jgi:hypothetical protein
MSDPIPSWLLERFALGELPPERMEEVRKRLDPAQLAQLQASNAEILKEYPPEEIGPRIRRRAAPRSRRWMFAPILAVAGMLAVWAVPRATVESPEVPEITRIKGSPALELHRRKGAGIERLGNGATAAPGDQVQLSYVAAGRHYGAIVSIDGRGGVSRHLPERGDAAVALDRGGSIELPSSFELDDAPRFERFFLVTSDAPFRVGDVVQAATALAARPDAETADLPLPPQLSETTFVLRKESK